MLTVLPSSTVSTSLGAAHYDLSDFDGDGDQDLVVAYQNGVDSGGIHYDYAAVFLSSGFNGANCNQHNGFTEHQVFTWTRAVGNYCAYSYYNMPQYVVTGDFNTDGVNDFAVTLRMCANIQLYLGRQTSDGSSAYRFPTSITITSSYNATTTPASNYLQFKTTDKDNDGFTDLVVGDLEEGIGYNIWINQSQ